MSGPNQHYIPQFLQRGFLDKSVGKPERTWVYTKDAPVELKPIRYNATEDYFYSAPSSDASLTLDDRLTNTETKLASMLAKLKVASITIPVNPLVASRLILNLAPRTQHMRTAVAESMKGLIRLVQDATSDTDNFARLLGLHDTKPSEHFMTAAHKEIQENQRMQAFGVPNEVVARILAQCARENLPSTLHEEGLIASTWRHMQGTADGVARRSHNKSVGALLDGDTQVRQSLLVKLKWSIIEATTEGAILPDCVVWSYATNQCPTPYMLAPAAEVDAVVMPLSSSRYLVGVSTGRTLPDVVTFNHDAASCSHEFFCASENKATLNHYSANIRSSSLGIIHSAMEEAKGIFFPAPEHNPESYRRKGDLIQWDRSGEPKNWSIEIRGTENDEPDTQAAITHAISNLLNAFATMFPLSRITTIFVGNKGDTGWVSGYRWEANEDGPWFAIYLNRELVESLTYGPDEAMATTINAFASEATKVAALDAIYRAYSAGFSLDQSSFDSWAFRHASHMLTEFIAMQEMLLRGFVDLKSKDEALQSLIEASERMRDSTREAVLNYASHKDVSRYLSEVSPYVETVLMIACRLAAICAITGDEKMPILSVGRDSDMLRSLDPWLPTLLQDLDKLSHRHGNWEDISEILRLAVHAERLFWMCAIILHPDNKGRLYIRAGIPNIPQS